MAPNTTRRGASAAGRLPPTCHCRPINSSPTPRSGSAKAPRLNLQGLSMRGHSTYQPQSAFMQWLERRLPIVSLIHSSFVAYPTPHNLNYWWTFGGILTLMFAVQLVTGIVLAMHYTPHVDHAFNSVETIMRDVNYGWLLRYMHANGASMFFLA